MPIGISDIEANLKCCMPNGMPMMVIQKSKPVTTWPIASQIPIKTSQIIFPNKPNVPVPTSSLPDKCFLLTASFPKGQKVNLPITKHALPHGIPMMLIKQSTPASHQAKPMMRPPKTNQIILPMNAKFLSNAQIKFC